MNPSQRTGQTSLTVVANRLPVEHSDSGWSISPGGLVAAVHPVLGERGGTWVGWDGTSGRSAEAFEVDGLKIEPIGLTAAEVEDYCGGFSFEGHRCASDALLRVGSPGEAAAFLRWMSTLSPDEAPEDLRPLYGIEGETNLVEAELVHLMGYGGSLPVRIGNAAAEQL